MIPAKARVGRVIKPRSNNEELRIMRSRRLCSARPMRRRRVEQNSNNETGKCVARSELYMAHRQIQKTKKKKFFFFFFFFFFSKLVTFQLLRLSCCCSLPYKVLFYCSRLLISHVGMFFRLKKIQMFSLNSVRNQNFPLFLLLLLLFFFQGLLAITLDGHLAPDTPTLLLTTWAPADTER